jgi:hypothetical protein
VAEITASTSVSPLLAANSHFSLSHKLPTPMFHKHWFFVAIFKWTTLFILCAFSHAYLRFVFMTVSVKTYSFKVTLESLFEPLSSFWLICPLRLHFTYHYPAGESFDLYSLLMLRFIIWLGFAMHLDLHSFNLWFHKIHGCYD